jgi:hypothetical protein
MLCKSSLFPLLFQIFLVIIQRFLHLPPVNQTKNKMKKVFSFAAIAALTMFAASCGNDEAEAKRKIDSAHLADSLAMINMQHKADSAHMADSIKAAADAMEMQRKADSAHMADSLAAAKKSGGKKPAAPKNPETPKVGKPRPGANK